MALVCDVYCDFATFPFGILGQVWYLIVSISDPCCLSYFLKLCCFFSKCNNTYFSCESSVKLDITCELSVSMEYQTFFAQIYFKIMSSTVAVIGILRVKLFAVKGANVNMDVMSVLLFSTCLL